jgi:hypothetical protein
MTDNGLAALAAALDQVIDGGFYYRDLYKTRPAEDAAAIIGERGVFLPDGLQGEPTQFAGIVWHERYDAAAATIATLRAALEGLVEAADLVVSEYGEHGGPPIGHAVAALRAALAAAKETP